MPLPVGKAEFSGALQIRIFAIWDIMSFFFSTGMVCVKNIGNFLSKK